MRKGGKLPPFRDTYSMVLRVTAIEAVGSIEHALFHNAQGGIGRILQREGQRLLLACGEVGKHPIGKILLLVRFSAHADLYSGKILTTQFLDQGFDSVVTAGRAIATYAKATYREGNVIEQYDNTLRRNVKIITELLHGSAGQIHIGLRL